MEPLIGFDLTKGDTPSMASNDRTSQDGNHLYGTLNLLILRTLAHQSHHGLGVLRAIEGAAVSGLKIEEGALYPALHRLERDGLIAGRWGFSESNRRAKFYELTAKGRRRTEQEVDRWVEHATVVARVLGLQLTLASA